MWHYFSHEEINPIWLVNNAKLNQKSLFSFHNPLIYGNFLFLTLITNNLFYFAVDAFYKSKMPKRGIRNLNMWTLTPVSQSVIATYEANVVGFNHCCSRWYRQKLIAEYTELVKEDWKGPGVWSCLKEDLVLVMKLSWTLQPSLTFLECSSESCWDLFGYWGLNK